MKATGKLFVVLASALLALTMSVNAGTLVDTMDGPTLNPFWTLDEDLTWTYGAGGGFSIGGGDGIARFNNVGNYAYAHIETANPIDTTSGIRVDAIMRQDNYPTSTFGMSVGIYYDANNWVSLKQGAAGGQNGWGRYMMVNGTFTDLWGLDVVTLRQFFLISGIELTATEIKFYGSQIFPTMVDHYGDDPTAEADYQEITELAIARPAGFTGNALVIIGKGWTRGDGAYGHTNPDFDNLFGSDNFAFSGIDYVRIVGDVPVLPVALQGTVSPEDYVGDLSELGVRVELRQGGSPVRTEKMLLGAGGEFSISQVDVGTYDIAVKVGGWLQKVLANVDVSADPTDIGTVSLTNGDLDGDNEVTTSDLATVLLNMDMVGD